MAASSEFSRKVALEPWPEDGVTFGFDAGPAERRALARRFGLEALDAFGASGGLVKEGGEFVLEGRLRAALVQTCVVSLDPVAQTLDEPVRLRFRRLPAAAASVVPEEDLDPEAEDVVPLSGNVLDLGEVLAEEFGLVLDPYPHAADAYAVLPEMLGPGVSFGEAAPEPARPFAALASLKS